MALVVPPVTDLLRRTRARGGTHGEQPMFPTIIAVRNGRVVAGVSTPRLPATLSAARTLAVGVDAAALILAAQAEVEGRPALVYTVMTRDLRAKQVLQRVELGPGDRVAVGTLQDGGNPQDDTVVRALAEAMGDRPVDVTRVARRDTRGTFGENLYLSPEQGRAVVDAGTVRTLHERVRGIAGEVFYVPRSPEAARLALEAGLPRPALLGPTGPEASADR